VDDNDSGRFGDVIDSSDFYAGPEQSFPMPDALLIGSAERAIPFSEYLVLDARTLRVRIDPGTGALQWQSAATGIGKVTLKWAGPVKPESVVIVGTGSRRPCAYDLTWASVVSVAAGQYQLAYGVITTGKGSTVQRALILPGRSAPFEVAEGGAVSLAL